MGAVLLKRADITFTLIDRHDPTAEYEYLGHGRIRNIRSGYIQDLNQKGMDNRVDNGFPDCKGGFCHKLMAEKPWAFSY